MTASMRSATAKESTRHTARSAGRRANGIKRSATIRTDRPLKQTGREITGHTQVIRGPTGRPDRARRTTTHPARPPARLRPASPPAPGPAPHTSAPAPVPEPAPDDPAAYRRLPRKPREAARPVSAPQTRTVTARAPAAATEAQRTSRTAPAPEGRGRRDPAARTAPSALPTTPPARCPPPTTKPRPTAQHRPRRAGGPPRARRSRHCRPRPAR